MSKTDKKEFEWFEAYYLATFYIADNYGTWAIKDAVVYATLVADFITLLDKHHLKATAWALMPHVKGELKTIIERIAIGVCKDVIDASPN